MRVRPIGRVAAVAVLICGFSTSAVRAETKVKLNVSTRAETSSNPFLSTNDNARAMMAEIILNPALTHTSPIGSFDLSSRIARRQYSRIYAPSTLGNVRLNGAARRSARLQLNGSAYISRDVTADVPLEADSAVDPRSLRIVTGIDVGANRLLTERSSIASNFGFRRNRFRQSTTLTGYTGVAGGLSYARQLNSHTRLGGRVSIAAASYEQGGRSNVAGLLAVGETSLNRSLKLTAEAGVERTSLVLDPAFPGDRTDTQFLLTGSVKLCHTGESLDLCGQADMRSQASGFGTLQRTVGSGITANYRFDRRTRARFGLNHARTTPLGSSPFGRLSFLLGRASIDRDFGKSLTLAAYSTYRRRSGFGNASDATVGAELRWNMGQQ